MGIITSVVELLRQADFSAEEAYPGRKYPLITAPVAAVHLEKADRAKGMVTVGVEILCPESFGGVFCEREAVRAMEALHRAGAVCTQNGCRYEGLPRVNAVTLLAEFPWVAQNESGAELRFKTFTWPNQPEEYREEWVRQPVYVRNGAGNDVFSGMGPAKRVITGSGIFFGTSAHNDFKALAALFEETGTGELIHPVYGSRTVYFTGLELRENTRRDYVAYSFEFTEADANGAIPQ